MTRTIERLLCRVLGHRPAVIRDCGRPVVWCLRCGVRCPLRSSRLR